MKKNENQKVVLLLLAAAAGYWIYTEWKKNTAVITPVNQDNSSGFDNGLMAPGNTIMPLFQPGVKPMIKQPDVIVKYKISGVPHSI